MWKLIDITGDVYGFVTVLSYRGKDKNGAAQWNCKCECGQEFIGYAYALKKVLVKSCGCYTRELLFLRTRKHGESRKKSKEYCAWANIKARCYNERDPNYKNYGAKNVKMCRRWKDSYENFLSDMGRAPSADLSIERIDVRGNYEPSNCKWATRKEQGNNRRRHRKLTFNGETKNISQWCSELGLNRNHVNYRLRIGVPVERILSV